MVFASRADAGKRLGQYLLERGVGADVVIGLPRGGVVVAAQVAQVLQKPLDVLIVRKIGHPVYREFAIGALAEGGVVVLDHSVLGRDPIARAELQNVINEEKRRLAVYESMFHRAGGLSIANKTVLLVDDGLATGATTEAAVLCARQREAQRVVIAAPVASTHAVERLSRVADDVLIMWVDPEFDAVGRYYHSFSQTTDEEVLGLLKAA